MPFKSRSCRVCDDKSVSEAHVLRPRFGRVLSAVVIAVCAAAAVTVVIQSPTAGVQAVPLLALFAFAMWAGYWRPAVRVDDDAVIVENVFRTIRVPFTRIQRIDTRFALTLYTPGMRVAAWAAPAPGRHSLMLARREQGQHLPESSYLAGTVRPGDLVGSESGAAAYIVRRRWEQLRDAGALDETLGAVEVRLHTATIAVGVALIGAVVLSLVL